MTQKRSYNLSPERQRGGTKRRRCTTCRKPTDNYRCDACWRKVRGFSAADRITYNEDFIEF